MEIENIPVKIKPVHSSTMPMQLISHIANIIPPLRQPAEVRLLRETSDQPQLRARQGRQCKLVRASHGQELMHIVVPGVLCKGLSDAIK